MITHVYHIHRAKIKGWHTICGQRDSLLHKVLLRNLLARPLYKRGRVCGECLGLDASDMLCLLCYGTQKESRNEHN